VGGQDPEPSAVLYLVPSFTRQAWTSLGLWGAERSLDKSRERVLAQDGLSPRLDPGFPIVLNGLG
jgi:hypothetical protein